MLWRLLIGRGAKLLPFLRNVPVVKIIFVAELGFVLVRHARYLNRAEWARLLALLHAGRPLTQAEKLERKLLLSRLHLFALGGATAEKFSPVPFPNRLAGRPTRRQRRQAAKAAQAADSTTTRKKSQ